MRTAFQRISKSGTMSKDHLGQIAERFIEVSKLPGPFATALRDYYNSDIWSTFFDSTGGTAVCNEDRWTDNIKKMGKKESLNTTHFVHDKYFEAVDDDKDGFIKLPEFKRYFYILGIKEEFAKAAFDALDLRKDGRVSRGEFITAGNDFFYSETVGLPSDLFFGPLV